MGNETRLEPVVEAKAEITWERIDPRVRRALLWTLLPVSLLGLVLLPYVASAYAVTLVFLVFFWTAAAQSWNLFSGYTGYVNFGYVGLLGVGAYTSAILIGKFGARWLLALIASGLVTALFGFLIGIPFLRVRGIYFAISMLGLAEGLRVLFSMPLLTPLTGGGAGIGFIPGMSLNTKYYAMGFVALLVTVVVYLVANSRFGLQLLAIREDELAAETMGINTTLKKLSAFTLSAFLSGLAGGLYATYVTYLVPGTMFVTGIYTLTPIVMATFGGLGTVSGPVVGAVLFTAISETLWARFLFLHLIIFGVVLIFIILFMPQGIIPWLQDKRILPRARWL